MFPNKPLFILDCAEPQRLMARQNVTNEKTTTKTMLDDQIKDKSAISRRRYSHGNACRKSQSMDFLNCPASELSVPPSGASIVRHNEVSWAMKMIMYEKS